MQQRIPLAYNLVFQRDDGNEKRLSGQAANRPSGLLSNRLSILNLRHDLF